MRLPMNRRRSCTLRMIQAIAALAATCLAAMPATAQTSAAEQLTAGPAYTSGDGKTEPQFPAIDLLYQLRGRDGSPIPAHPGDLKLFAQGQEIATAGGIRPFDRTGYGITAILAIDASGSMRGAPLSAIHDSISKFVDQARSQDQVAVTTFADQTQIDVPFGSSRASLAGKLQNIQVRGKFTRLYDGMLDALALFTPNQPRRRQLVVISDGHDEGSQHSIAEVLVRAKSLGVVIDSIGLSNDHGEYLGSLQQISLQTGGSYVRALNGQQLEAFMAQGIAATRATPVAAFLLNHIDADGKLLSAQLRWQPGNLSATAFIPTPKSSLTSSLISNVWIWALGSCFVIGVILLLLSLRGPRTVPEPAIAAPAYQAPRAAPQPQPPPMQDRSDATRSAPARTPTLVEGVSNMTAFETPPTSKYAPVYPRSRAQAEIDAEQRRPSRIASTFDAPAGGPYARLQIKNGKLAGQSFPMTSSSFTIGSIPGNQLILPGDSTVSARHLSLHWENSRLSIEDNRSTNGIYLNRVKLPAGRHLLKPGDEIGIGQTYIVVERV
jgi:Mg-chelatase subunit ChlD